jgi:hypothetical protein
MGDMYWKHEGQMMRKYLLSFKTWINPMAALKVASLLT